MAGPADRTAWVRGRETARQVGHNRPSSTPERRFDRLSAPSLNAAAAGGKGDKITYQNDLFSFLDRTAAN